MTKRRLRADGTPSPRGGRTPKPPPTEEQLAELERLTDAFPADLKAFRDPSNARIKALQILKRQYIKRLDLSELPDPKGQ